MSDEKKGTDNLIEGVFAQALVTNPAGFDQVWTATLAGKKPEEQADIIMGVVKKAQEKFKEDNRRIDFLLERTRIKKDPEKGTAEKDESKQCRKLKTKIRSDAVFSYLNKSVSRILF